LTGNVTADCPAALYLAPATVATLTGVNFGDGDDDNLPGDLRVGAGACWTDLGSGTALACPGDGTCR